MRHKLECLRVLDMRLGTVEKTAYLQRLVEDYNRSHANANPIDFPLRSKLANLLER